MTKTEMITLLAHGVDPQVLVRAQAANSIARAIRTATYKVEDAAFFKQKANWTKLFELFEGVLEDSDREYRAE